MATAHPTRIVIDGQLLIIAAPVTSGADIEAVIARIDQIFTNGSFSQINSIKVGFGLQDLDNLDVVSSYRRLKYAFNARRLNLF